MKTGSRTKKNAMREGGKGTNRKGGHLEIIKGGGGNRAGTGRDKRNRDATHILKGNGTRWLPEDGLYRGEKTFSQKGVCLRNLRDGLFNLPKSLKGGTKNRKKTLARPSVPIILTGKTEEIAGGLFEGE